MQWKTHERNVWVSRYNVCMSNRNIVAITGISALVLSFSFFVSPALAAEKCSFTRDLEVGINGEDVRCLQTYLNSAGFKLADTGPGAPGAETTLFRDGTKAAVVKWQIANGVSPATGYFGPLSRAKYEQLINGGTTSGSTSSADQQREDILARIRELQSKNTVTTPVASTGTQSSAKKALEEAIEALQGAEEQVDDAFGSGDAGRAGDRLADARQDFYRAVEAYLSGNYDRTISFAAEAEDNAMDAYEDAGGETEEDEIESYLEELEEEIEAAWEQIEEASDDGEDVDQAEELLEEAEDKLEEAEDALDDGNYDEAENLGDEVEDLIDDAIDAIGNSSDEEEAEDAIKDAKKAIRDAKKAIDRAEDDGEDTDDAEDLLEEAEELLEEAEEAFDDEDFDDAIDLADEAEDLAKDAIDEL